MSDLHEEERMENGNIKIDAFHVSAVLTKCGMNETGKRLLRKEANGK